MIVRRRFIKEMIKKKVEGLRSKRKNATIVTAKLVPSPARVAT